MHESEQVRMQRAGFLRRAALVAGSAAGAAFVLNGRPAEPGEAQTAADERALNLALVVEYAEADFYAEAVRRDKLEGELRSFAEQVAGQEDDHVAFIQSALGSSARKKPQFDFGESTGDSEAFADRAAALEDLAVAAYAGQAGNLSKGDFAPLRRSSRWRRDMRRGYAASSGVRPPTSRPIHRATPTG